MPLRHCIAAISGATTSYTPRKAVARCSLTLTRAYTQSILAGKSIAVKDNIVTTDLNTTASSKILAGLQSPYEATIVRLLKEHGATISQKAEMDEFGMGSHTQTPADGPVLSPFSRRGVPLSPGGSSGGSAVAVAKGQCFAAIGTDTGGSVRLPAAYTGVVGFKPSYGLLSRWGVIQYANSLDTVGILAKNTSTVHQVFNLLNTHDERDPSSMSATVRARLRRPLPQKYRIGVPVEYNIEELDPAVRSTWKAALQTLQNQGHSIHRVSLPSTQQALSAYYVLAPAEASSNLAKYDGIRYGRRAIANTPDDKLQTLGASNSKLPLYARARDQGFGEEVKRRILLGAYSLSSEAIDNYYIQAQKVRRLVQQEFDQAFTAKNPLLDADGALDGVDIMLTPTAPTLPPTVEEVKKLSPLEIYMNDVFTIPASLAGLPALNVSARLEASFITDDADVQTVGLQIIGQYGDDEIVLHVGKLLQDLVN